MNNPNKFDSRDEFCNHGIKYHARCFSCDAQPKLKSENMKQQTTYVLLEINHHGDAKKLSELTAQAAYVLSSVDNARVLIFGAALPGPEVAIEAVAA